MLEENTLISVTNRDNGRTGYQIPELGVNRQFAPTETKKIPFKELRQLSYIPGGLAMLQSCLIMKNKEAVEEIIGPVEPEYFYTEVEIKDLLVNGDMDSFLDFLDFAPSGALELAKDLAVTIKLNDVAKRDAIAQKLGFNVSNAIAINKETDEEKTVEKTRRAAVQTKETSDQPAAPQRRTTSKYSNIVYN